MLKQLEKENKVAEKPAYYAKIVSTLWNKKTTTLLSWRIKESQFINDKLGMETPCYQDTEPKITKENSI